MIYDFLCQAANPKMTFGVSVTMRFDPRKYSLEAQGFSQNKMR